MKTETYSLARSSAPAGKVPLPAEATGLFMADTIQRTVRIGTPADQDDWRREDYRRLTPEQRLALAVQLREQTWPDALPIQLVFSIRRRAVP